MESKTLELSGSYYFYVVATITALIFWALKRQAYGAWA